MKAPPVRELDVSGLPSYRFSHHSLMWWGTAGVMLIEGTVFAMVVVSYFYLRSLADHWPMAAPPPDLAWGTLNTAIMLASLVPNHLAKKAAEREQLGRTRMWLWVGILFGLAFLGVRALEFGALNVRWDTSAYGSVVWFLMGLHTAHLLTDVLDSIVLGVLLFTGPMNGRRFVDTSENALYWYFVVLAWLPIYGVVYWGARL